MVVAYPVTARSTVFHIDDDPLWSDVVEQLLSRWPSVSHIGCATSGREGVAQCRDKQPAIVLLDVWLHDGDGLGVIDELAALPQPPRILVLTRRADDVTLFHVWFGEVAGLIWKTNQCAERLRNRDLP